MSPLIDESSFVLTTPFVFGAPLPFTDKHLPSIRDPRRGDVVVINTPGIPEDPWYSRAVNRVATFFTGGYISLDSTRNRDWENRQVIKRIVAVPRDTLRMKEFRVEVRPAGETRFISETALISDFYPAYPELPSSWNTDHPFSGNLDEITLREGEFFLLGDNRGIGIDSLYWGPVARDAIHNLVICKYWPWPFSIF